MFSAERENFEHLESLHPRKWPFQSRNSALWTACSGVRMKDSENNLIFNSSLDYSIRSLTRDRLIGPTFLTILDEMWTDFLRYLKSYGGCHTPHPHPPNVRP